MNSPLTMKNELTSFYVDSTIARYGTAVLLVSGAILLTLAIWSLSEPLSSPLFLVAIVITAWRNGFGPGIFATLLSGISIDYFFVQPTFGFNWSDIIETSRLVIFTIEGFILCWLVTARNKASQEIQNSREQLQALLLHQQTLREEERKQIALEIHDELGQLLTGLKIELHLLSQKIRNPDDQTELDSTDKKIKELLQLTDKTVQTVRRIATDLRPAILDDFGLIAAVEWQTKEFERRTGISCSFSTNAENIETEDQFAISIFRILQESLTNIMRHSRATSVKIDLKKTDRKLVLHVEDNGAGIELENMDRNGSLGIFGMRERARLIGGELLIFNRTEGGTIVLLTVSLP